jgi:fructose-1,6-bisphosphatase/sedoheptulose 1,7-bisphosphatase-like protein
MATLVPATGPVCRITIPKVGRDKSFVAGSGITDGLLFDGVKFEKDCTRTSSLVISNLDNTCRFTNTVHIKDGAQSIALS